MQDFRNLEVWNKAHNLTLDIYRLTESFPRTEVFGLSIQLRRGAASIATNLAEGCGRAQSEFGRFLQVAFGAACEVEYQLLLSRDLQLITGEAYTDLNAKLLEVKRMLHGLLKRVQRDVRPLEQVAAT
ncbi:MAG TPA: four helix bundle protein [Bryocella sp.]|nr:four helix bundle protein [Bryocella sp.]